MSTQQYCPLCAEEMDLIDEQFKPCTCGYQICVWCWNHLVGEAEKDEVLCPGCLSPYDKKKIKEMTICSDRLEEIGSMEKQKTNRTSELMYDPSEIRVVQRNIAYITGIPVNLAKEKILHKREFFGQYGKIMKILIKYPRPGSPHYAKTSAVFVTFSKEEEAIKCIQLTNGFILNGSLLKACYGTSKYCHFWLQKKPCKNQDCLFVHHPAPPGDICTKDNVASVCTSKLQHCVRTESLLQQISGSFLPPPADSYYNSTEELLLSSVTPNPVGSGLNWRSGKNKKSSAPSRVNSSGLTIASHSVLRTSTSVCEGPFNTSSMTNSSITSPAVMEVCVLEQARDEYQNKDKIFLTGSHSQGLGRLGNSESSQQDRQSCYPIKHIVAPSEVSPGKNTVVTNTVSKPYSLWGNEDTVERIIPDLDYSDSRGFKQKASMTPDLTRKSPSSILLSGFGSSAQLASDPVRECPVTCMQDSPISILQDMTLSSPYSQKVPHVNPLVGYSDLELTELASKAEAKGSVYRGIGTHDAASVIIDQKFGEFPQFLSNSIGTSFQGELKKSLAKKTSCQMQDFELKDMGHSSDHNSVEDMVQNVDVWWKNNVGVGKDKDMEHSSHHNSVEDMVQNVDAWCKNNVDMKKDIISDKNCIVSREYIVKPDMSSSLNPGLAVTCQSLADRFDGGTYRGGDCSNVFNSWSPFSSSASTVPFAILGGAKHTSGQSLQGTMDVLVPDKEYHGEQVVEKKIICREESTHKPIVGDLKNFDVQANEVTNEAVNELKHLLRLPRPASSITKQLISPAPKTPPGFPPKPVLREGQKCSRLSGSSNAQSKFTGKQSLVSSSQMIPGSESYFNVDPTDIIKVASKGGMLESATRLTSPVYSSSLVGFDGSDRRVQSQLSIGNLYLNPVEADQSKSYLPYMAFHGADTYRGSQEACIYGSPSVMDSQVIGRRGETGLSNSTNNATSILHHQFLQPFSGENDPRFQATDSDLLRYSQPR